MNGATASANLGVRGTNQQQQQPQVLLEPTKLLSLFEKITKTTSSIELQITINTYVSIYCRVLNDFYFIYFILKKKYIHYSSSFFHLSFKIK